MINFRYHIVSLMAVFLALAVGHRRSASRSGPGRRGARSSRPTQDRKQVTDLRAELDRRNALDDVPRRLRRSGSAGR